MHKCISILNTNAFEKLLCVIYKCLLDYVSIVMGNISTVKQCQWRWWRVVRKVTKRIMPVMIVLLGYAATSQRLGFGISLQSGGYIHSVLVTWLEQMVSCDWDCVAGLSMGKDYYRNHGSQIKYSNKLINC